VQILSDMRNRLPEGEEKRQMEKACELAERSLFELKGTLGEEEAQG